MKSALSRAGALAALVPLFAFPASAQGTDDCATPTSISGLGTFPFNNSAATTGVAGQTESLCGSGPLARIDRDVWFTWIAPASAAYQVQTCSSTTVNTKISIYDGASCPTSPSLGCNDNGCSAQAAATFTAIAGNAYVIQLGSGPSAAGGSGTFDILVSQCWTPAAGADVVVGEIPDVFNTTPVGGVDAISLGTTSCNVGTTNLNWNPSTTNHPVIRQNLYRYKIVDGAGRFEQLGMSWLKHASSVAPGNACCTCTPLVGSGMSPGCSDPYGASLNSGQTNAGPNWEVNAYDGTFPLTHGNPPWSGTVARRCQFQLSDVEATGSGVTTRFFGEGHYVARDDSVAGNQNNNVSWREITVTGTSANWTLALTGPTQREQPAIRAWARAESGVTITEVQVPGEGLLLVGSKATQLAPNLWRYEYAVYNMNSDRAVGRVAVPLPADGSLANVETHAPTYHSGDGPGNVGYSALEWTFTRDGGHVVFATETQAENVRANAVRWGTLYNYRFDSSTPPVDGELTLGLWKPGTPAFVGAAAQVPGEGPVHMTCAGDESGSACPCGNTGAFARGCANSVFASGARLWASGTPSITNDTLVLESWDVTGNTSLFFQGDVLAAPVVFDDGLTCASGAIVRLGLRVNAGFASSYPQGGDPSVSVRGALPALGGTYVYQAHYRNTAATFCPPATSNRTNALQVTWSP